MIRKLEPGDVDAAVRLVAEDTCVPADEVAATITDQDAWVFVEDGTIRGLVSTKVRRQDYGLRVYVGPRFRNRGIGGALYAHVRPVFDGPGPDKVTATYRVDTGDARAFFARRGFRPWFRMAYLAYCGDRQPEADFDIR